MKFKCPECKNEFDVSNEDIFHKTIAQFGPIFLKRKLIMYSTYYSPEKFRGWAEKHTKKKYGSNNRVDDSVQMSSELYWSLCECQFALGNLLWLESIGGFVKSVKNTKKNDIELPAFKTIDLMLISYIGDAWEHVYRVWARLENILKLIVLNQDLDKGPKYLADIIAQIKKENNLNDHNAYFRNLKRLVRKREDVAGKRNGISHRYGNVFTKVKITTEISPIYKNLRMPFFSTIVEYPDPGEDVKKVVDAYKFLDTAVKAVIEFVNFYISSLKIVRVKTPLWTP